MHLLSNCFILFKGHWDIALALQERTRLPTHLHSEPLWLLEEAKEAEGVAFQLQSGVFARHPGELHIEEVEAGRASAYLVDYRGGHPQVVLVLKAFEVGEGHSAFLYTKSNVAN